MSPIPITPLLSEIITYGLGMEMPTPTYLPLDPAFRSLKLLLDYSVFRICPNSEDSLKTGRRRESHEQPPPIQQSQSEHTTGHLMKALVRKPLALPSSLPVFALWCTTIYITIFL